MIDYDVILFMIVAVMIIFVFTAFVYLYPLQPVIDSVCYQRLQDVVEASHGCRLVSGNLTEGDIKCTNAIGLVYNFRFHNGRIYDLDNMAWSNVTLDEILKAEKSEWYSEVKS